MNWEIDPNRSARIRLWDTDGCEWEYVLEVGWIDTHGLRCFPSSAKQQYYAQAFFPRLRQVFIGCDRCQGTGGVPAGPFGGARDKCPTCGGGGSVPKVRPDLAQPVLTKSLSGATVTCRFCGTMYDNHPEVGEMPPVGDGCEACDPTRKEDA